MTSDPGTAPGTAPAVTVVVPTKDRPELMRRAVDAAVAQDYAGDVHVLVVYDGTDPDESLVRTDPHRRVSVTRNDRTPGLAGGRNTGILLADTPLVAFCDDDDAWLPAKLTRQVEQLDRSPDAVVVSCGIRIEYGETSVDRSLPRTEIVLEDLLRKRLTELHSSTFLFRREPLVELGMVNEDVPGSFGEDYELLLRIARRTPVVNVPDVLVRVRWHVGSHFTRRWDTIVDALEWLLREYPEFAGVRAGEARITGQLAFANAALGRRGDAVRWAKRTVTRNPREARAYLAVAVASGAVTSDAVLRRLQERGRSI